VLSILLVLSRSRRPPETIRAFPTNWTIDKALFRKSLREFSIQIRQIPSRLNIVLNALSQLSTIEARDVSQDNKLDNVYAFSELSVSEEFKIKLRDRYAGDSHFACVLRLLRFDLAPDSDFLLKVYSVNFDIRDSLLYYNPLSGALRLCIFNLYIKTLLFIVYNKHYFGFN
jgi:hypothetical protein